MMKGIIFFISSHVDHHNFLQFLQLDITFFYVFIEFVSNLYKEFSLGFSFDRLVVCMAKKLWNSLKIYFIHIIQ